MSEALMSGAIARVEIEAPGSSAVALLAVIGNGPGPAAAGGPWSS